MSDSAIGGHGAYLHTVDLLTGGALQELPGGAEDELLETGEVVGVATLVESEGGLVLVTEADAALSLVPTVPRHRVPTDQIPSTTTRDSTSDSSRRSVVDLIGSDRLRDDGASV